MSLLGIHHLTAVCTNVRSTVDFYTTVIGLRLVKKTVNFDDPGAYHLYFGDETGSPGTLITFFEWSHMSKGHTGIGATHHLAFVTGSLMDQLRWKRWLIDHGIGVTGPYNRRYFSSIYFADPDGLILEIATLYPGWLVDETVSTLGTGTISPPFELTRFGRNEDAIARLKWEAPVEEISPGMRLIGLHHITAICSDIGKTTRFYTETLGMRLVKRTINFDDPTSVHYYYGAGSAKPGTIVTYFEYTPDRMRHGAIGTGMTHHFAFAVADEETQLEWRVRLEKSGVRVTPVMDRVYFKSVYFHDPDGHILEIATAGPGFLIDEPKEELGSRLRLPKWLEPRRRAIEESLTPISALASSHEPHPDLTPP